MKDTTQLSLKTTDRVIAMRLNKLPSVNAQRFVSMVTCSQNRRGQLDNSQLIIGVNLGGIVGRSSVNLVNKVKAHFGFTVALYVRLIRCLKSRCCYGIYVQRENLNSELKNGVGAYAP
jgi:hypothetical protein